MNKKYYHAWVWGDFIITTNINKIYDFIMKHNSVKLKVIDSRGFKYQAVGEFLKEYLDAIRKNEYESDRINKMFRMGDILIQNEINKKHFYTTLDLKENYKWYIENRDKIQF